MDNRLAHVIRKLENRLLLLAKRTVHGVNRRFGPKSGKQVVFVGGIHRSGTNMIMDVLERSFETDVYHESDPRAFEDYQMRPGPVIHRLVDESNTRHLVIKALCELHEIGELLADFAPAKALWVVRNFDDMVNSHLRKWSGCPATIGNIVADRNNAGWRGGGMSDSTHALVKNLYTPQINDASAVALFWYFRNILFFEQGFEANENVLAIRYESLVTDPQVQFARVFEFLGIAYTPRLTRKVFASSIRKNLVPDIDPEIRGLCEGILAQFDDVLSR